MNSLIMIGRLTKDPELKVMGGNNTAVCRFSIAVNRRFKQENQPDADFFNCVSFGKTAEFVEKYFHKGSSIVVQGELRNNNYTNKEGVKVYTNEILVNNVEFSGTKAENAQSAQAPAQTQKPVAPAPTPSMAASSDGFMDIPDGLEDELPFS